MTHAPLTFEPGPRSGVVDVPVSKSHLHRLLIASFLSGARDCLAPDAGDSEDIAATRRCLAALAGDDLAPRLECGESGSTLRFLAPVAAALGKRPVFVAQGRLASRPSIDYSGGIRPGLHELPGDVSSQFVTGLLFALPLLDGDSEIRFTGPLQSRGYVDMTLDVLRMAGIRAEETAGGFLVPGSQRYSPVDLGAAERDWSGAAFWLAMDAMGSSVEVPGLNPDSRQPDRAVVRILSDFAEPGRIGLDVSAFPDLFPALAVAAARRDGETVFTGIGRLRLKESDRVAAMADVLARFGRDPGVEEARFIVRGSKSPLRGGSFATFGDHRIAMAIAVGATVADSPVEIDDGGCMAKSYPGFARQFAILRQ